MDLTQFCDEYIIAEYLRIKVVLNNMPRYKLGIHRDTQVIRSNSGSRSETSRQDVYANSPAFPEMKSKLAIFEKHSRLERIYRDELKRRKLAIPERPVPLSGNSEFDVSMYEQLISSSNPLEIKSEYYDDFGFHVRSRGEMLIGNTLKTLGLEAKYEPELILKGERRKHPDYSFPVRIIDRCFFVEFIGMAGDDNYIDSNYGKIDEYMRNGILPNRDLILISGTKNWIPEQESIKRIIASFINNAVLSIYNRKA